MADKYTDITNKEQLSFCIRTVDNNLEVKEDFLGFYELENIKSVTVMNAIKDILLRFNLSLQKTYKRTMEPAIGWEKSLEWSQQTYSGASNMMGKKSGVATKILAK